jgi:uroporphyrinogen decarboxylase
MMEGNPGERRVLLDVLRGEATDPPPLWIMRQAGRYLPEYRALRTQAPNFLRFCLDPDLATEATLQPIRRYGFDGSILFSDILTVPYAMGVEVWFAEGEGPRLTPVRDAAAAERLAFDPTRLAPVYETVRRVRAALPPATTLLGFAGAPWTVAAYIVEGSGSRDWIEAKRWAYGEGSRAGFRVLIDRLVEATIEHLALQLEAGADAVQLFDSWAGSLDPAGFERFVIEPTQRIVAGLRARVPGARIIGFPRQAGVLYPRYAAATGVDAVSLDTSVPLDWATAAIPAETALQGNLDPLRLLAGGASLDTAIDVIRRAVRSRRFIFNLGHGVLPPTPPEHVAQLVARVRA